MELLVVLGIFSMVVTAASDIFMLANRSQRKVFGMERTQADARFTMEAIVREVRTGRIDYAYYAERAVKKLNPLEPLEIELALVDSTDVPLRFFLSDQNYDGGTARACSDRASVPCLLVSVDGGAASPITPRGVKVASLGFYISPLTDPTVFDPNTGAYSADEPPRVTVALILESVTGRAEERGVIRLQTTVINRRYDR